jgi:DNA-binding NarL/FixJ family response regulator
METHDDFQERIRREQQIAARLRLSPKTVRSHLATVLSKLGSHDSPGVRDDEPSRYASAGGSGKH